MVIKIVIPGGSGQIGSLLSRQFHADDHEVVVLSRTSGDAPWRTIAWDARTLGAWSKEIDGVDVVINLAGRSVNCRYSPENRRAIRESRINSTRIVGQSIAQAKRPPHVWLQASTATIYSHRYDAPNDEETGIVGSTEVDAQDTWRFSTDVARSWEQTLDEAVTPDTRKVAMRSAMTMSPDRDGVFDRFLGLVRHGLGGSMGDGRQYVSWIHYSSGLDASSLAKAREGDCLQASLCGIINGCKKARSATAWIRLLGKLVSPSHLDK